MLIDLLFLLALVLLNGVFAMSEIAVVSSKRPRLLQMADAGSRGARHAIDLAAEPTRFLSSVQVGITSIGILSGAIGGASIAARLEPLFERIPSLAAYAEPLALGVMVVVLSYASLILGELVPKRLALTRPEAIAALIARPMQILAAIGRPIVWLLSASTDAVLRLFRVQPVAQPAVTVEEIKVMLAQGEEEGVVEPGEHDMLTNVLNLDDRYVGSMLTPRASVIFLDVREPAEAARAKLRHSPHAVLPLCDGGLDQVLGVVRGSRLLAEALDQQTWEPARVVEPALFVPESLSLLSLLEQFKRTHLPLALVVDEFGSVEGVISLTDVVSAIVGELPLKEDDTPAIARHDDGSWVLAGALNLDTVIQTLDAHTLVSDEDRQQYHTLGGLAMQALGRVPQAGDVFERAGYRFEVVAMDRNRVDRVLVRRRPAAESPAE